MCPHPEYLHRPSVFVYFINEPMLNVDTARIGSRKIAAQLLVRRWSLKWVPAQDDQERLSFRA